MLDLKCKLPQPHSQTRCNTALIQGLGHAAQIKDKYHVKNVAIVGLQWMSVSGNDHKQTAHVENLILCLHAKAIHPSRRRPPYSRTTSSQLKPLFDPAAETSWWNMTEKTYFKKITAWPQSITETGRIRKGRIMFTILKDRQNLYAIIQKTYRHSHEAPCSISIYSRFYSGERRLRTQNPST